MNSKIHRLVAICGALMLLLTVAMAMRTNVATIEPAPAPKAAPHVKVVVVPPVVVGNVDDNGCSGH